MQNLNVTTSVMPGDLVHVISFNPVALDLTPNDIWLDSGVIDRLFVKQRVGENTARVCFATTNFNTDNCLFYSVNPDFTQLAFGELIDYLYNLRHPLMTIDAFDVITQITSRFALKSRESLSAFTITVPVGIGDTLEYNGEMVKVKGFNLAIDSFSVQYDRLFVDVVVDALQDGELYSRSGQYLDKNNLSNSIRANLERMDGFGPDNYLY